MKVRGTECKISLSLSLSHSLSRSPAFPSPFSSSLISSLSHLPSFSFFPPSFLLSLSQSFSHPPSVPPLSPPSLSIFIPPSSLIFPLPSSLLLPPSLAPLFLSALLSLLPSADLRCTAVQSAPCKLYGSDPIFLCNTHICAGPYTPHIYSCSLSFLLRLINKTLIMRFVGLRLNTRRGLSLTILMCTNMPAAETKELLKNSIKLV